MAGESRFIPCTDKDDAAHKVSELKHAVASYGKFFPVEANALRVLKTFSGRRWWAVLEKLAIDPLIDFTRRADGSMERSGISDPERNRRISLMWNDGYSVEEIEKLEGELTPDEIRSLLK